MQTTGANADFLRNRFLRPSTFLVSVLLFLLPFVEIRCNGATMAENSGVGLAIGRDFKEAGQMKSMKDSFESESQTTSKVSRGSGELFEGALLALALALAAAIVAFISNRTARVTMILGALAAVSMIVLLIQVKSKINEKGRTTGEDSPFGNIDISAQFTAWYWISLVLMLLGAYFSYLQSRPVYTGGHLHEEPPAGAPQTPLHNPGDQSEFPAAPRESEIG